MTHLLVAFIVATAPDSGTAEPPAETPAVESEGFQQTRWGMNVEDVRRLYPAARGGKGRLELADARFAGERARIEFAFDGGSLTGVAVQLKGERLGKDAVLQRCLRFRELLSNKYGEPADSDLRWQKERPQDADSAAALANGQLAIRGQWVTPTSTIELSCERRGKGVVTGLVYSDKKVTQEKDASAIKDL